MICLRQETVGSPELGGAGRRRWRNSAEYLVIKTRDRDASSLNTPTEEELTRQLIRLLLEQAQIAALSNNQLLFDKTLGADRRCLAFG